MKEVLYFYNIIVENTQGLHWVSIYINNNIIEYFDPQGREPNGKVSFALSQIIDIYKNKLLIHKKQRQKNSYDCGIYCCWYATKKMENIDYHEIERDRTNDNNMRELRCIYRKKATNYSLKNKLPIKEFGDQEWLSGDHLVSIINSIIAEHNSELVLIGPYPYNFPNWEESVKNRLLPKSRKNKIKQPELIIILNLY